MRTLSSRVPYAFHIDETLARGLVPEGEPAPKTQRTEAMKADANKKEKAREAGAEYTNF